MRCIWLGGRLGFISCSSGYLEANNIDTGLFGVCGAGGVAEGGELGVEEFGGEGSGERVDGFALLRGEADELGLGAG